MLLRTLKLATLALMLPCLSGYAAETEELTRWKNLFDEKILPIMKDRCNSCHSGDDADGELDLSKFSSGELAAADFDLWERVGKRIRLREMPPEGSPQLNDAQKSSFHRWVDTSPKVDLCSKLANDETQSWYRGFVMSRRLTQTEYLNAMRDVVGVEVDARFEVPSDGSGGEGFDTNGDTLFTSPIHIEQYLGIASEMVDRVLDQTAWPASSPDQMSQTRKALLVAKSRILEPAVVHGFKLDTGGRAIEEALDGNAANDDAARAILGRFSRLAWRRPVDQDEIARLMELFHAAQLKQPELEVAIREPLKAILISPNFLFVVEAESPEGGVQRLTQHQLATRMALFLWSSVPDAELLDLADAGELDSNEQILAATQRMLKDDRARALGENFGLQWLGLRNLLTAIRPDPEVYPQYTPALANDLREEAILTIANVLRNGRSLLELIDSDVVYVNGSLAQHYGLEVRPEAGWQSVATGTSGRGGVVTLGATLMSTSYPRRTSPVLRGRWLLEEILGSRVPPPPPNVPALEEAVAEQSVSLRERLELHRKNAECASCHNRMDPLGFGLENFDGLGRWRETDHNVPIDSSGKLPSGESFNGPSELKNIILARSQEFEVHFVRKLLGFALGRQLNKFDDCVIEDSLKALREREHNAWAPIETIVTSFPFQYRYFKAATSAP